MGCTELIEVNLMAYCLKVLHFASIYKFKKHFDLSIAYDAPRIWDDLPDDKRSAKSLSSFSKESKPISLQKHTHPSFLFLYLCLSL